MAFTVPAETAADYLLTYARDGRPDDESSGKTLLYLGVTSDRVIQEMQAFRCVCVYMTLGFLSLHSPENREDLKEIFESFHKLLEQNARLKTAFYYRVDHYQTAIDAAIKHGEDVSKFISTAFCHACGTDPSEWKHMIISRPDAFTTGGMAWMFWQEDIRNYLISIGWKV